MTNLSNFELEVDAVGHGRITVDGVDCSDGTRAVELVAAANEVTQLVLHRNIGSGKVKGAGVVQVVEAGLAQEIASLDEHEIEQEVLKRTQWGNSNVIHIAVQVIRERLEHAAQPQGT